MLYIVSVFLLLLSSQSRVYQNPSFFSAFYCNPGGVAQTASRTYDCLTPKVIPQADKFGLSLLQMDVNYVNKTGEVQFTAVTKSTPGTDISRVVIEIANSALHTIEYTYIVIVVGYQPENTWMDLVCVNLPNDNTLNPLNRNNTFPLMMVYSQNFTYASKTKFTSGSYQLVSFISSFYVNSISGVGIKMNGFSVNATNFRVQYERNISSIKLMILSGTIMVYNPAAITAAGGQTLLVPKTLTSLVNFDYSVDQPLWGPAFQSKCIVGYNEIKFLKTQISIVLFSKTSYDHYFRQTAYLKRYRTRTYWRGLSLITETYEQNYTSLSFRFSSNFLCFTNKKTQCGEQEIFYDPYTDGCFTSGTLCPVPTSMPTSFTYPIPCTNCSSIFCITCDVSNRNNCTLCDAVRLRINDSLGKCVCKTGFYQKPDPIQPFCVINCTFNIPNCRIDDCTSSTNCTICRNGFYLNPVGSDFNCLPCSANCLLCTVSGCYSCATGYVITQSGLCDLCSNLLKRCATCSVYSACTQCENSPTTLLLSNQQCKTCSELEPNCVFCQRKPDLSDLLCNQCVHPLVPVSSRLVCISCSDAIQDCVECTYDSVLFMPKCTICLPKYIVDQDFKCQRCKNGTWIQRQCYYIIGCSSVSLIYGRPTCLACTQRNFQFESSTGKCVCQRGYEFNLLNESCTPKCGDGIRAYLDEECDDGNLFNLDGCSDQCKVEPDFFCSENSKDLSKCIYQKDVKVIFDYIIKVENKNQAKVYFRVEPASTSVSKVDWSKAIMFTFSEEVTTSTSYVNGILVVTVDYKSEVEGKDLQLDIIYDPKFIIASHQQMLFPMKASNGPLSFQDKSQIDKEEAVGTAGFVLGMICLVCYLISTFFHKMIGLETLQFIQLIYFVRIIASEASQSSLNAFNSLRYSNGYSEIYKEKEIQNSKIMQQIPPIFLNLNMKLYYLDNCNLMLIPIALATLAYIYFSIKKSWILKRYLLTKEVFVKDEFFDLRRKVDLLYGNFIFSYTISLLYITIFSMLLYELSQTGNQDFNNYVKSSYAVSMVVLFFIAIIFCSEAFNGVQKHFKEAVVVKDNVFNEEKALERDNNCQNQDYHPLYVSVYLLYQLLIIVLINSIFADFNRLTEVLSISAAIYMIVMMVWRPYIFKIHNFAIVFNQAVVVMFLGFQLLQKYGIFNEAMMEMNLYLTISLIGIALALQVARLYIQQSSPIHVFQKTELKSEVKRKKVDLKDQKNKFLMVNQIKQRLKEDLKIEEVEEMVNTENFSREFCHRVMNKKKLKIDIPTNSKGNTMLADKIISMNQDEFNEDGSKQKDNDVDIDVVKERLRRQLNYKKNRAVFY